MPAKGPAPPSVPCRRAVRRRRNRRRSNTAGGTATEREWSGVVTEGGGLWTVGTAQGERARGASTRHGAPHLKSSLLSCGMRSLWTGSRATTASPPVEEREATARAAPTHRVVEVVWTRGGGRRAGGLRVRWGVCELQHTMAQPGDTWLPAFLLGTRRFVERLTPASCSRRAPRTRRTQLQQRLHHRLVPPLRRFVQGAVVELARLAHLQHTRRGLADVELREGGGGADLLSGPSSQRPSDRSTGKPPRASALSPSFS
jgi:hypothetical protein